MICLEVLYSISCRKAHIERTIFMFIPNTHVYKAVLTSDDEERNDERVLWSISDATRNIPHLSAYMIRKMIKEGNIIPIKLGRRYYVVKEELLRLVFETNRTE